LVIGILGDVAASAIANHAETASLSESKAHLLFCARFFDSYFQSRLNGELDIYMLLLASATYYLADLPGSASVFASRLSSTLLHLGGRGTEDLLSWILKGDFATLTRLPEDGFVEEIQVATDLARFSMSGERAGNLIESARRLRQTVYHEGTARQLLLSDLVGAVVRVRTSNSTWATLPSYSGVEARTWVPILQKSNFIRELWPAQRLLGDRGLYRGGSAVIQLPASAGKTRSVDLIIRGAVDSGRTSLAIVVAPFRALSEEIRQSLLKAFEGETVNVNELTDVQQNDFEIDTFLSRQQVLVMTPEKCLYVLRQNPELADTLGLLIYVQGHQFDSGRRGVTYELLLTSLRAAVRPGTQTVLVSAVLNNAQAIADWLLGANGAVVSRARLLPTSRALAFVSWRERRLEFTDPSDPEIGEFFVPRIIEQEHQALFGRERRSRVFPQNDAKSLGLWLLNAPSLDMASRSQDYEQ
jgi:hypothetical protein